MDHKPSPSDIVSLHILQAITPKVTEGTLEKYLPWLNQYMEEYGIDTPHRAAAFLAQIAHESGEFRYTRELGSDSYLEKYDTGQLATRLGNTPADDGDGQLYRGRGLIQITGADNYRACGRGLGVDLLTYPELLESPQFAVASACWYWGSRSLNGYADNGNFLSITKRINGGTNGHQQRVMYWNRAKAAYGIEDKI